MTQFSVMYNRVVTELRRSNLVAEAKQAINDAIREAAKDRFYLNEVRGLNFPTVIGQEYYSDQGLVEIDALYYLQGTTRYNIYSRNNIDADTYVEGNNPNGLPLSYSRQGMSIRLEPIPNAVVTVYADGYGKLTPYPLVNDIDTNNWMTEGEAYIRALAKRNLLRDVVQNYGAARAMEAIAMDEKDLLEQQTSEQFATGCLTPTRF